MAKSSRTTKRAGRAGSRVRKSAAANWPIERGDPAEVGLCPERLERAASVARSYITHGDIVGVITAVARRGRLVQVDCAGMADVARRRPMREDTLFRIYSMTKLVTSVAALMLLEETKFVLTDPIAKFIPEFADVRVKATGADGKAELVRPRRPVTIHDLLTHTSGISYELYHQVRYSGIDLKTFVRDQAKMPLEFQPGERWMYGASTDVLGRVIEVASGMKLDAFFKKRIFTPLGMTDTDFHVPPAKSDRFAWVYKPDDNGRLVEGEDRRKSPFLRKPVLPSGGGGLISSTSDYLRFSLMLLNGGQLNGRRLLGRKTVELMRADHLPRGHAALDVNDRGFGLGVSVARSLGEAREVCSVGEFGWGGAACTQAWIDPAEDMVTLIMMQLFPKGPKCQLMNRWKQAAYAAIVD